jgi:hypothetical protein
LCFAIAASLLARKYLACHRTKSSDYLADIGAFYSSEKAVESLTSTR